MFRFLLTFSAPRGIKLFKILKKHILTSKAEYANIPPIKAKYANISLSPGSKVLIKQSMLIFPYVLDPKY